MDAATFVIGDNLYYGSGFDFCANQWNSKFVKLDLKTKTATRIPDLPAATRRSNGFARNGKGYVLTNEGDFFEYDVAKNKWNTLSNVGFEAWYGALVGNTFYAISVEGKVAEYIPGY